MLQGNIEIENYIEVACIVQIFYYYNGRLSLTNGFLSVPDRETRLSSEKISIKILHEMFKDTKSHGLVSLQLISALNFFLLEMLVYQKIQ